MSVRSSVFVQQLDRITLIATAVVLLVAISQAQAQVRWSTPPPQDDDAWDAGQQAGETAREQLDSLVVLIYDEGTGLLVSAGAFVAGEYERLFEDMLESRSREEFYERRWTRAAELGEGAAAYVLDATESTLRPIEAYLAENDDVIREFRRGGARFVELLGTTGYLIYDPVTRVYSPVAEFYRDNQHEINERVVDTTRMILELGAFGVQTTDEFVRAHHDEIRELSERGGEHLRDAAVMVVATMEFVHQYYETNRDDIADTVLDTLSGLGRVATGAGRAVRDFVNANPQIEATIRDAVRIGAEVATDAAQDVLRTAVDQVTEGIRSEGFQSVLSATEQAARTAASAAAEGATAAFSSAASAVGGFVSGFFGGR